MVLLGACEQQAETSQTNPARISYDANVHDKAFGKYIVHINALTTDQLPTEVARGYKISRSKNRAMLNVSVREKQGEAEQPITASVSVIAKNLSNQLKSVKLREITEADPIAIYYIGELPVSDKETIVFDIDVTPVGATQSILVSYRHKFFTE
ncbi:MAG: hypothetical protein DHS20C09_00060 [marine bacterium B5-7]|nr:MAG: hypothetical protein DHS20C09_00060 [marine bacterium B5-7]